MSNTEKTTEVIAQFDGLIDIVSSDGKSAFCVPNNDEIVIIDKIETSDKIFAPPPQAALPWMLADANTVKREFEAAKQNAAEFGRQTFEALRSLLCSAVELPSPEHYDLAVCWIIHTYFLKHFQYSPFFLLFALAERGKSRFGKALVWSSYRGFHTESLREAYIIRVAKDLGATIFFDVLDIWKKTKSSGSEDVILTRFEKGAKIPRVLDPIKSACEGIAYYETYGATIIATNEPPHEILETRCLSVNMPESSRSFDNLIVEADFLPIRAKLIALRALTMQQELPNVEKPVAGRLGDISRPLLQIAKMVHPEKEPIVRSMIERLAEERKVERSESIDAQIIRIIIKMQSVADRGKLSVKDITDEFNRTRSEKFRFSYQYMGRKLASFGFQKASTSNSSAAIVLDPDQLRSLSKRFGIHLSGNAGVTDDTDVSPKPALTLDEIRKMAESSCRTNHK